MTIEEINAAAMLALRTWGPEHQVLKAAEECAEASAAILQWHARCDDASREAAAEEIADVLIMMTQVSRVIGEERVRYWMSVKAERLLHRIDDELATKAAQGLEVMR